ncbi:response regulator [Paraburkholderia sp. RL17-383-BIF-A]|jgi:CheY-like chemotaxis protein|uniref:response regulator n=1 Tax=Burkholderiaceae TaxID=119060 RepID=UPI0008955D68|nr:response regulator [Burkholderia sp. WP9]SEF02045.1 Response regulator receiver domain-containing protein [Burkholderia sp. WP9]
MHSILLVDDEPDILTAWHLILIGEGYEVRCAANGAEALRILDGWRPHLIITDWMMPLVDGRELCRHIKSNPELSRIPVLVHTAAPAAAREANCYHVCLQKPAPINVVLTTVAKLCGSA